MATLLSGRSVVVSRLRQSTLFWSPTGCLGKIGDWKNTFTREQDLFFNGVYKSNMKDCALEFVWEE